MSVLYIQSLIKQRLTGEKGDRFGRRLELKSRITVVFKMILSDASNNGRNLLKKFLSLHILTINRVICPPLVLHILNIVAAERADNRVERRSGAERSGEREL